MSVICSTLWFRILWAHTYVGTILLLMIQWVTLLPDLSLRNTFWKAYLLLASPNLCIWKFLNSLHHFRNHLHTWIFTEVHVPIPVWEHLLIWEDICKQSTVNVKVIKTRNITWMSAKPLSLWDVNTYYLSTRTHKKLNSWQKCEENAHVFTT
jgi:hypothetical protein